jgi:hypothetical protein
MFTGNNFEVLKPESEEEADPLRFGMPKRKTNNYAYAR